MKAHIPTPDFTFSSADREVLITALNLFISNEIEGVSKEKKEENNSLALSVGKRIQNRETRFNAEDMRIMIVALSYFRIVITETSDKAGDDSEDVSFRKDSDKFLAIIDRIMDVLKGCLKRGGIDIDEV